MKVSILHCMCLSFFQILENVISTFCNCKKKKAIEKSIIDAKNVEKIHIKQLITKNGNLNMISSQDLQKIILKKRRAGANLLDFEEKTLTSYKKRAGTFQESACFHKMKIDQNEVTCPVCMDFIINATITTCGHTFCERCISEALNLSPGCPICRYPIRNSEMTYCKSLDQFIKMYSEKHGNIELSRNYKERVMEYEMWKKSVRLENINKENDIIDVRDSEYIWCVGIILKTIKRKNKVVYLIHYKGWSNIFDEYIPFTSPRLAMLGVYTKRLDIPRYIINEHSEDNMNGYITTGGANQLNNNFILINDSIDEGNLQEIAEIRPLENISREAFNSHTLHFFYYAAVNAWNQNVNRNNNNEVISVFSDRLEENNQTDLDLNAEQESIHEQGRDGQ